MVLITGCTGYIGSRLAVRLLSMGIKVKGLVLPKEMDKVQELKKCGIEVFQGDLCNAETLKGLGKNVEFAFHMAGLHSSVDRMTSLYVNGTKALINELKNSPLKGFYLAGNGAVYGDCGDEILYESNNTNPTHPFGLISLKTEKTVLELAERNQFPWIIFRIAEVYGDGQYDPFKNLRNYKLKILGDGTNYTSKIHIDDLIELLLLAFKSNKTNKIYNICDDLPVRQKEFYEEACSISGYSEPEWVADYTIPHRIRLSIHGLRMLSLRMSNRTIKEDLNYKLKYPAIREGLTDLFKRHETVNSNKISLQM